MTGTPAHFESGYANVNGTRLYYEMAGAGTPVTLVHGMSLDLRMWDDQFAVLASDYRVIRYDARGFGKSDTPPPEPYSNSRDLLSLLDSIGIERAHMVGLSMGGRTVIDFVIDNPGRALSLVPVDSGAPGVPPVSGIRERVAVIGKTANDVSVAAAMELWCSDDLFAPGMSNPRSAPALNEIVREYSGWHWTSGMSNVDRDKNTLQSLATIPVPTLVILGELDLLDFHASADAMEEQIPGARKAVIPNAGHMSNMEAPAAFNDLLLEFLAGVK